MSDQKAKAAGASTVRNPLLAKWRTPFELPPFEKIRPAHFRPAIDKAIETHKAEVEKIFSNTAAPNFANTVAAMEKAGADLTRVLRVFYNLTSADTNPELQAIEREIAPILSQHHTAIALDPRFFARVDSIYSRSKRMKLDDEQRRVLERTHTSLVRSGARLDEPSKKRMAEINARLATLGTTFGQNVLADEQAYKLVLETEADLAGLPDFVRAAAKRAGNDLGHPGKHVITLARSSIESFLQFSTRRDLREIAFAAWIKRGEGGGEHDNRAVATEILALRAERAHLLGFQTFAKFRLEDAMAKTPEAVRGLLDEVWTAAVRKAGEERDMLQRMVDQEGGNFQVEAWDWRHYAEKVRKAEFDLDEGEIKPYLQLDRIIEASFDTATRLFGLSFEERADLPKYHPDARTWEVKRADGTHAGVFIGDYFARPSKRSGAWMSAFRSQQRLRGDIHPVIVNVLNFARGADGEPTLLSFTDARTLFHEFGHALHGLMSDVTYPSIAGTAVSTDFVELPSQLYEHWLDERAVLQRFARHHKTNAPIPDALIDRLDAANKFNQGFATVEYVSSALADMELHALEKFDGFDLSRFEADMLKRIGMPREIVMRHRLPHFAHIFSGGGYAAGYYSYMWSEVMDADAFEAFEETGNAFDPATAKKLAEFIYSAGNRRDPVEAYTAFRGRLPTSHAMLKNRGLI
ncbi:M3 family metallopeptidase [Hyphomicrobium sp. CS1BSMeth3]|uniref:M3 family metallopeptidase n=1 Tax=Hyphomicrobium sp. CS1BSMeth3 TaxID=1892844 RepID=UPI00093065BC|nr:M3 family metallopeptidase [Hyphomicrobium sp. CS1BSMeth3]